MGCSTLTDPLAAGPSRVSPMLRKSDRSLRTTFTRHASASSPTPESPLDEEEVFVAKRKSVLSLNHMEAWNNVSRTSVNQMATEKKLQIHRADSTVSTTETLDSPVDDDDVNDQIPDDTTLAFGAMRSGPSSPYRLPSLRKYAEQVAEGAPVEPFPVFVERRFQPHACEVITDRLSAGDFSECSSPVSDTFEEMTKGTNKYTEQEWLDLEEQVFHQAAALRACDASKHDSANLMNANQNNADDKKAVNVASSVLPTASVAMEKRIIADVAQGMSFLYLSSDDEDEDASDAPAKKTDSKRKGIAIKKRQSLPYYTYGGVFSPFKGQSSVLEHPFTFGKKMEDFTGSPESDLSTISLPSMDTIFEDATSNKPSCGPAKSQGHVQAASISPLLLPVPAHPQKYTPSASYSATTGLVTRNLTNASAAVPTRVVMNASFPVFATPAERRKFVPTRPLPVTRADVFRHPRRTGGLPPIPEASGAGCSGSAWCAGGRVRKPKAERLHKGRTQGRCL